MNTSNFYDLITSVIFIFKILITFLFCITFAAYLSLFERKIIARVQMRLGPSYTGFLGILQPLADALKLFFKRGALQNISRKAILAICLFMATSLISITLIPLSSDTYIFDPKFGLLYAFIIHTVISFLEIMIGVESGSKYGIIGGIRGYFQMISTHFPYLLSILCIGSMTNSFNLIDIVELQNKIPFAFIIAPVFVVFFIVSLINLNRTPFDFTEAESEIIAGNYVEYGGMLFGMIYLSEYLNLIFSSSLIVLLFLGGWSPIFGLTTIPPEVSMFIKVISIIFVIILIRSILPRYKQTYVIHLSWIIFCPIIIIYFVSFESMLG